MKTFWIAMLVLLLAAAGLWLAGARSTATGNSAPSPAAGDLRPVEPVPPAPAPTPTTIADSPAAAPTFSYADSPTGNDASSKPDDEPPAMKPEPAAAPDPQPAATQPGVSAPTHSAGDADKFDQHLQDLIDSNPAQFSVKLPEPPPAAAPASKADVAAAPLSLVKQDDGTSLVDNRFSIKGAGTKDDPYIVPWEMLLSSNETYQPRLGRKIIPERIKMLDGKWIKMGGYIAFPLMAQSQDEMLMMLNQWDGCCIGVPPTPYDAIEVKLREPAKGEERFRISGTVTGILRVDPYLVKDWLVSLYLMDDAVLTNAAGQQPVGEHVK